MMNKGIAIVKFDKNIVKEESDININGVDFSSEEDFRIKDISLLKVDCDGDAKEFADGNNLRFIISFIAMTESNKLLYLVSHYVCDVDQSDEFIKMMKQLSVIDLHLMHMINSGFIPHLIHSNEFEYVDDNTMSLSCYYSKPDENTDDRNVYSIKFCLNHKIYLVLCVLKDLLCNNAHSYFSAEQVLATIRTINSKENDKLKISKVESVLELKQLYKSMDGLIAHVKLKVNNWLSDLFLHIDDINAILYGTIDRRKNKRLPRLTGKQINRSIRDISHLEITSIVENPFNNDDIGYLISVCMNTELEIMAYAFSTEIYSKLITLITEKLR